MNKKKIVRKTLLGILTGADAFVSAFIGLLSGFGTFYIYTGFLDKPLFVSLFWSFLMTTAVGIWLGNLLTKIAEKRVEGMKDED